MRLKPENLSQNQTPHKCTVGCPVLDRHLGGGVPCNSVTELVGESATGKTQFCLQLVLSAQLPPSHGGLSASSIYIHTEFPFPFRRLQQLSRAFRSTHPHLPCRDPCDRVFVRPVNSTRDLLEAISTIEVFLQESKSPWLPVRVVVIDSIAAIFRSEFDNTGSDLRRRSSLFFTISGRLKLLANKYGLVVVVTNQVVDFISGGGEVRVGNFSDGLSSSGRRVCPALGLAWAHCVNSRLFLSKDGGDGLITKRRISLVFAPHLPFFSSQFVIRRDGIFGVDMLPQQQQLQRDV
ncbi:hypothetical protein RJT34_18611 [Clitoria ternatea]|uniref:RecA family profile 1 domain-containing protein n=1 Tax=Clitoria ternatea TaxID=43366 RepID=A0AAN9PE63_CLITE